MSRCCEDDQCRKKQDGPLHFTVRPREGRRTVLAYAILSEHQLPDHLGTGWCIRSAGDGTCCGRLRARRTLVARYCSYNLRVSSGTQVHRMVSGVRTQKGEVSSCG